MNTFDRKTYLQLMGSFLAGGFLPDLKRENPKLDLFSGGELIYQNPFSNESNTKDFILEGQAYIRFLNGRLQMENKLPISEGKRANFVYWCPKDFPKNIRVEWDFYPLREPGLCVFFFGAKGINGESIFDSSLQQRQGIYSRYHSGDINAYHLSYFRRKHKEERGFQTCNLRKSKGFHMVAQGADPIPSVADSIAPYKLKLVKHDGFIAFSINELVLLEWQDNEVHGKVLNDGKIGFRQMAPLIAEYSNLNVFRL